MLINLLQSLIGLSIINMIPFLWVPVCDKILEAAASVVCSFEVPLEMLLHFISSLPREFTDSGGK